MSNWYIFIDQTEVGPFADAELHKMIDQKKVDGETPVREQHAATWQKLKTFAVFFPPAQDNAQVPPGRVISMSEDKIRLACPNCNQHYSGDATNMGRRIKCQYCATSFLVPKPEKADTLRKTIDSEFPDEIPGGSIICPHCWKSFNHEYILYVSQHPSLIGDPLLGEFEQKRFSPTAFNGYGQPLDAMGMPTCDMACPHCHLRFPATIIDLPSFYCSIVGAPSSGKSYYLTCLVHQLRRVLSENFCSTFIDVDPLLNQILDGYERLIFMPIDYNKVVMLPKTQQTGNDFSDQVLLNGIPMELPKPFVFEYRAENAKNGLNLVFYDNAGEHFQPGADVVVNPATQHLSCSNGIIFLFDPINDAVMRRICDTNDPQVTENAKVSDQTMLFSEMINRIRRHRNMNAADSCDIPLIIAVGKYDNWYKALDRDIGNLSPVIPDSELGAAKIDRNMILDVSYATRELMLANAPGLVNTAESFFKEVYFIPVSNFGGLAARNESGGIGVVPNDIKPLWVEVPFLLLMALQGIIGVKEETGRSSDPAFAPKISGDYIVFPHPETGKAVRLPLNYLGGVIRINGRDYAMPPRRSKGIDALKGKDDLWS